MLGRMRFHVCVADVMKFFATVYMGILECVLDHRELFGWLRKLYFANHAHVRLRFKLATFDDGMEEACALM